MTPKVSMREALSDPRLLGRAIPGDSWRLWRVLLIAAMGERLDADERDIYRTVTSLPIEPGERVAELWTIAGRRSGKTRAAGVFGAYVSALCDWSDHFALGERGVLPVLATSQSQADRAFSHIAGVLDHSPLLRKMIESRTADMIRLSTRVDVQVRPANFRSIRGITAVSAIGDETAFWHDDSGGSRNPDKEILDALRPALITTGGMLVVISSPYARKGELFRAWQKHYGRHGDVLIAKGPSKTFNSTLPDKVIARAYEADPAVAAAEYGGEFRTDVESLIAREVVEAAVNRGVTERPRVEGVTYYGFVDPSGGSSDSMTLAVAHREGDRAVLDVTREAKPPYSPEVVVEEFAGLLQAYGLSSVTGDRFAGEWVREPFRRRDVEYRLSDANKSELYLALVPALNSSRVSLLDDDRLVQQLVGLERRTSRGGRDAVDHAPGAHDDLANSVAGAIWLCVKPRAKPYEWYVGRAGAGGVFVDGDGNRRAVGGYQGEPVTDISQVRSNPWTTLR